VRVADAAAQVLVVGAADVVVAVLALVVGAAVVVGAVVTGASWCWSW
jgi:hypothetical protein